MRIFISLLALTAGFAFSGAVNATETITYSYDAKGRLIQVVHAGTVNNNVTVNYIHDTADNRINVATSGSSN